MMIYSNCILLLLLLSFDLFPQESVNSINLFEVNNRIKFADYLFCSKDYLRATEEYKQIYPITKNDTIKFKMALSYLKNEDHISAYSIFSNFRYNSLFFSQARQNMFKIYFLNKQFDLLENEYLADSNNFKYDNVQKLILSSKFLSKNILPNLDIYKKYFDGEDFNKISNFYLFKQNPPIKSKLTAGLLSLFPGLGKIYIQQYGDGITAFLSTSAFTALAITNFNAKHNFRGWLFSGLAAAFYAGSIYGSIAGVPIYNAKIFFDFNKDVNNFIEIHNYFLNDYNFCN